MIFETQTSLSLTDDTETREFKYCSGCGYLLTPEEQKYYEYHCEECERYWAERVSRYRNGADDPMIDLVFSA